MVKSDDATAKKWGADPANAKAVLPQFRHILVKAPANDAAARAAARRKAQDVLTRLDRGESFATLAKTSDDPGSSDKGGAYPGRMVKMFVPEVRRAYAELAPGQRASAPVETSFGWHVIEKGPIDDEACIEGHRTWLARNAAERIGRDVMKRLRHVVDGASSAAEVQRAFVAAVGSERKVLEDLPSIIRLDAATCDGFATIARGEGISWRDDVLVVAALTDDARDATEIEAEGCDARDPKSEMSAAEMARMRALIERELQKQQNH